MIFALKPLHSAASRSLEVLYLLIFLTPILACSPSVAFELSQSLLPARSAVHCTFHVFPYLAIEDTEGARSLEPMMKKSSLSLFSRLQRRGIIYIWYPP